MHSSIRLFQVRLLVSAISAAAMTGVHAAEQHADPLVEEIIVTSSLQQSRAETALPVNVLSGEALREKAASTLGETLKELVGVNSASFGTGVGSPIIRGQSGNRVQVLQGGVSNIDASAVSPDHANSVEAVLAERIEVVRGPATLLYGNGAIGGVVNVIDNRVPATMPDGVRGLVETRHGSASDQQISVMKLEGGSGQIAWHLDGTYRDSNDTRIKGFSINPDTLDLDDAEELEELLASKGFIDNSSTRSDTVTGGLSWMFSDGYLGMSISQSENNYGLPAAAHHHHEDEHGEEDHDHDEEEHDHEEEGDHADEGGIRIAMKQDRYDFEGRKALSGFFAELNGKFSMVDYEHAEIEGNGEVGTVYANEGYEGRFTVSQVPRGSLMGVSGVQFGSKEFSATGEEAYIARTDIGSFALFTVQSLEAGAMTYELGLRGERQALDQGGSCDISNSTVSSSASALWRMQEDTNLLFAVAHSQRAPTVEERFSNINTATCKPPVSDFDLVAHAATQRYEIGKPDADKEESTNIEFGLRRHSGAVTGELNFFYNNIADYLYLRDSGALVDDVEVAYVTQDDAVFRGVEAEVSFPLFSYDDAATRMTLFGDYVRARLDGDGNVPRIPAMRAGAEVSHTHNDWLYKLRATRVAKQSSVAVNESETDGYTLLSASVDYHATVFGQEMTLFAQGSNLLDEEIRNHVSVLKDVAPEAGRNLVLGLRMEF
jgi:iron complex outermembrane receptor protein